MSIYQAMLAYFVEDEWPILDQDGQNVVQTAFVGQHGQWYCFARARNSEEQFLFYSVCPVRVPAAKRPFMTEFIARANYRQRVGNLELDYENGEIRYKTSLDPGGAALSAPLLRRAVYANVLAMDHYLPAIMDVLYADAAPKTAVETLADSFL